MWERMGATWKIWHNPRLWCKNSLIGRQEGRLQELIFIVALSTFHPFIEQHLHEYWGPVQSSEGPNVGIV